MAVEYRGIVWSNRQPTAFFQTATALLFKKYGISYCKCRPLDYLQEAFRGIQRRRTNTADGKTAFNAG